MRDKILLYLKLSGVDPDKMIDYLVGAYRQMHGLDTKADEKSTQAVKLIEASLRDRKGLVEDRFVEMLAKIFTEAEMDEINAFYQTPVGAKMSSQGGKIAMDLNDIGMEWNVEVMKDIELELSLILG